MLHKNKEWFQAILSSLHETAIVVLDKEGYIVSLWGTPELDKRYGVPASDVVGKSVRDILPPEQVTQTLTLIQHIFNTGEKILVERPVTLPGGDFWQETAFCPMLDKSGNVIEVVGYIRDITKRKKMEEALLQSEKLKSLGIITSGIAHEFNNVLAIIQGFAHLLMKKHGDRKKMEQYISKIFDAVADGNEIVHRMDEFVHAKKDTTDFIPVNMAEIVKQAIDLTKPRWKNIAHAKGVVYDIDTDGIKEVAPVLGTPSELREVLRNIINNDLDAMHDGGRLSFRTEEEDDTVFVSISDTGEGMDEDVQKKIFDPFFTTRSPKGKGLGLSMSYGIITRHGGKIDVESELGKGSTFTIRLPRKMKQSV